MGFVTDVVANLSSEAANLSSEAAKGIFEGGQQFVRYVKTCEQNIDNFKKNLNSLTVKRKSVQQEIDDAGRSGKKIKADVEHWCTTVDKEINEGEKKVKDLEGKAKRKYFGWFPNFNSRYQCSLTAEEGARTFDGLIDQSQFTKVGYLDFPEAIPNGFETFKSREKVFNDIMEAMKDATISMIGVYGMPGVGKTSLVNEVARQVKEVKLFDRVVIVTVAQTPNIQKIQANIAEFLSLKLKDESTNVRASRLHEGLKKEKTVLVVLDDIWKRLDFNEVGIPFGNQHKGCKILLTSRDQNVLSNEMDVNKTFALDDLKAEEAWDLFRKMAGADSVESAELRSTAIEVAQKCARLPLAIATFARALRNQKLFVWKDALRQLRLRKLSGKYADAYLAIELSYNHLESEELKQVFLLCSLVRRGASIEDLLKYAIGLGLIKGVSTVEEARNRLLTMVSDLKASCLLLDGHTNGLSFDVHDLVYDVAMSIASNDNHTFALNEEDVMKDWPDEETMKKCKMIHLGFFGNRELPDELNCPHLVYFSVFGNHGMLPNMPPNFFRETISLKVLHVTNMHFSSLSLSTCLLTSLSTLCLDWCKLGDIAIIGELKNLEILSFSNSDIKILPKEIGGLVKLKLLDLSYCSQLKIISPDVLSSFPKLEELYMSRTFIQWEVEGHANHRSNASLAELKKLTRLAVLEVNILDVEAMSGGLFFEELQKLERYKIFIGNYEAMSGGLFFEELQKLKRYKIFIGNYEEIMFNGNAYSRTLVFYLNITTYHLDHGMKMLLKKPEALYLNGDLYEDASMIEYIFNDNVAVDKIEFSQLRYLIFRWLPCLISFCFEDKSSSTSLPQHELPLFSEKILLPCLEHLELRSTNVERIWHNSRCNLGKLTTLIIQGCHNLKHLLTYSMARKLVHLKDFTISFCNSLREIISAEDIEEESKAETLFPKLASLSLENLQHLIIFCSKHQNINFPSLKSLVITSCPELKGFIHKSTMEGSQYFTSQALFNEKVTFPSLETIFISNLSNIKMICQNRLLVNSFPILQQMQVLNCDDLLTIFSTNTLRAFQGLQTLRIERCLLLEKIFEVGRSNMGETRAVTPQLRELRIENLPSLKCIWKNDPQEIFKLENLQVIHVRGCLNLKNIFPASLARSDLPQLRDLQIVGCGGKEIVSKEQGLETAVTLAFTFDFDQQASSLDDLPTTVALTMHQGSTVTTMDFHPLHHTLLLVGSVIGEIILWELRMRDKLVTKPFKIWDMSTCTTTFQALMVNDTPISVSRVTWSPDGSLVGVAFSKHLIHLYAYHGSNDLIQHLEIDAHVGGVNDLAFAHINKRLCIVTCGDDKLIKAWDSMTGLKWYNFEGHDAPVYSICPHQIENIPFIFSTTVDGNMKAWLYDNIGSRVDYGTEGPRCTTMLYGADGSRLFFCRTSEDGQSILVEWNESKGAIHKIYEGFRKKSTGVVSFDTMQNHYLVAGEDSLIKFWKIEHYYPLRVIDAEGGLPSLPRVRFNKEGTLLAVTTADNGFKILANAVGLTCLRAIETSSFDPLRTPIVFAAIKASDSSAVTNDGPVSCKVERSSPVKPSPILNGVDPLGRSVEKPRVVDDAIEKTKTWKLTEIVDPIQCRLVTLLDNTDNSSRVVRLLYTNSGVGILALGSNGVQKLWKWLCDEENPSGKATANVVPQHWQPNSGLLMTNDVSGVKLEKAVPCIALSKDDSYVMSATGGKVSLFNIMTFKVMTTFMSPPPASTFLAFHPQDNNIIAIGMEDSTILIYNVRVDEVKSKLRGHQKRITGLAFSTKLNILVSSGADAHLFVWSIDTWEKRKSVAIQIPAGKAPTGDTRVQFHSDQIRVLVVRETQLAIYDASKMERIQQWVPQDALPAAISCAAYSCNSQSVYATFYDGNVGVFDANSLILRCRISSSMYLKGNQVVYPLVVAAHPMEANQFAIGLSDGSVKVMEPTGSEGKWGVSAPVDGSTTLSSTTSNHTPEQLLWLEEESGFFFNMNYFEEKVEAGEWEEAEKYLSGFTKLDDNGYSMKIFFEIRKQKYLEALDGQDKAKAVEILGSDLKVFSTYSEKLYKELTQLLTLNNFREHEQLSKYGDTIHARRILLVELKKLFEVNPVFYYKLANSPLKSSKVWALIWQS